MQNNYLGYYTQSMLLEEYFMQFPKWLMSDEHFSKLSNDAKVLYTLLKDRHRLSLKNHWIDREGNVFLICKRTTMEKMLHKSNKTTLKIFQELLDCGLVSEKQNGQNKPNYIYLHIPKSVSFVEPEYEEDSYVPEEFLNNEESPETASNVVENPQNTPENASIMRTCKNYTFKEESGHVKITRPDMKNLHVNSNNKYSNNKTNNILNNDDRNNFKNSEQIPPIVVAKETFDISSFASKINSYIQSQRERYDEAYRDSSVYTCKMENALKLIEKVARSYGLKKQKQISFLSQTSAIELYSVAFDITDEETRVALYPAIENVESYLSSRIQKLLNC